MTQESNIAADATATALPEGTASRLVQAPSGGVPPADSSTCPVPVDANQKVRGTWAGPASFLSSLKTLLKTALRKTVKLAILPDSYLRAHLLRQSIPGGPVADLDLRTALLWGWSLDRIRRNFAVSAKVWGATANGRLTVLDVGASEFGASSCLPPDQFFVCSLDLDWAKLAQNRAGTCSVAADGCRLPFADGAFDVVVSVDSLEHIPKEIRVTFLQELERVARKRVVMHFPANGPGDFRGTEFDAKFQRICESVGRPEAYTEEHLRYGLPDAQQVASRLPGCSVYGRENGSLWLRYMILERLPYVGLLTGLLMLPFRKRLDTPPYHAALLVYEKQHSETTAQAAGS